MTRHPIIEEDVREITSRLGGTLDALEGRSILVTGANGMLAAYLVETIAYLNETRFRSRPCRTIAIVRTVPSRDGHLAHLLSRPEIQWVRHDARTAALAIEAADFMILAASKGSPRHYLADPIGTLALNGSGLGEWLDKAAALQSRAVLFFSSGEVYGTPDAGAVPTPETFVGRIDPLSPRSVYAEAKRYGEALSLAYQRVHGVPAKIVRPFQIFGPGMRVDDGRALPDFLSAAAAGQPIPLRSTGSARRTFMYVADATVAFWQVLILGVPGCVYNVGCPAPEVTVQELAEKIARLGGAACTVIPPAEPEITGAPERTVPDITKLAADFAFEPRHGLDDLLSRTLQWLRTRPGATA
jgi:UDP-glucuronate decarboxylase